MFVLVHTTSHLMTLSLIMLLFKAQILFSIRPTSRIIIKPNRPSGTSQCKKLLVIFKIKVLSHPIPSFYR